MESDMDLSICKDQEQRGRLFLRSLQYGQKETYSGEKGAYGVSVHGLIYKIRYQSSILALELSWAQQRNGVMEYSNTPVDAYHKISLNSS